MLSERGLMCGEGRVSQCQPGKELLQRADSRRKHRWSKSCGGRQGRKTGGGRWMSVRHHRHHHHHHHRHHHSHYQRHPQRPAGSGAAVSLRPVNMKGNRARGMRAPKNTNQFLMHEKYQLLHMRSDSVGSDSGSSTDSDTELTDMDSYLGVLENARGALLDSPEAAGAAAPRRRGFVLQGEERLQEAQQRWLQEDSLQYFPSEDDLLQSQHFMQRDFVEFCDIIAS
ncbi:coiled-coil domain-containing glutamate-rich protein 1 [Myripristis murdjan]|uniref:coiled-coil domain-containing glutamate-rich protein 1 n=1 Tax=Myripristis murdjan TaxID=586833 RepID=UPI0011762DFC|nr:coiled-coil domain-containing glutamate-rich protein 1-like [Myripristis murdjan]